ncbi:MAG: BamA/TamA family outer membrane protein [Gammaproteobacteria bacterium]|nr:BamA/TamA family outer membrane protein [Gammaproteobacteria bacterium]MBU2057533.1 BamA/TamA family outer membrane protein [Gammaproteobacteria bacterium]MBU2176293.1 BamA/TamA family outer membrane protein [Gammaproteobacteria bacterium]MBU2245894.1 BamA/TamA family outer membrane protein [Gammaproteobacteria bacterium]MBU2344166.1 BamA/TamA family outer membrane protein [Gammaproteobacteria bacterium]
MDVVVLSMLMMYSRNSHPPKTAIFALFSLLFSSHALASDLCTTVTPTTDFSAYKGQTIGQVLFIRNDVFDLEQPNTYWFHRFANRTHIITTETTLQEDVLFKAGDQLDAESLAETERLLRTRGYLRKVEVRVSHQCPDQQVIVTVHTWDNWSLLPKISLSREGGESRSTFGLAEDNLFGTGNQVNLDYEHDSERTSYLLNFRSPNMFGSHWGLNTRYADKSDGESYLIAIEKPFYRLHAPWSFALTLDQDNQDINEYLLGEEANEYQKQKNYFEIQGGLKLLSDENWVQRFFVGATHNEVQFKETSDTLFGTPKRRDLSQFWLAWQYLQANYRQMFNIYQFNRVEDINLGWQADVKLAYLAPMLGADDHGWQVTASAYKATELTVDNYLLTSASSSQLEQAELSQTLLKSHLMWVHKLDPQQSLVGQLTYQYGNDLFRDERLSLGGDTGLRAFPLYYQTGERLALATMEYRYYSSLSIAQIFDVGYATFADVGRTWGDNPDLPGSSGDQTLYGIGAGIRLLSSHSSRGTMIHIDLTKAYGGDDDLSGVEWRILAKQSF